MLARSPAWMSWASMIRRCHYAKEGQDGYAKYASRGIVVCERWRRSFTAFLEDMGPRPGGTTLDRIDSNGNYEPGNCRWATLAEQARNKRNNAFGVVDGQRMCLADACRAIGRHSANVRRLRRERGISTQEAFDVVKSTRRRRSPGQGEATAC